MKRTGYLIFKDKGERWLYPSLRMFNTNLSTYPSICAVNEIPPSLTGNCLLIQVPDGHDKS